MRSNSSKVAPWIVTVVVAAGFLSTQAGRDAAAEILTLLPKPPPQAPILAMGLPLGRDHGLESPAFPSFPSLGRIAPQPSSPSLFRPRNDKPPFADAGSLSARLIKSLQETPAPAPASVPPAPPALDDASLERLLKELGYELTAEPVSNGGRRFLFRAECGTWRFPVRADLSTDKTTLWLSVALMEEATLAQAPASRSIDLLRRNHSLGPTHYCMSPDTKVLLLSAPTPNAGISKDVLASRIATLVQSAVAEEPNWNPAAWATAPSPPTPAPSRG